MLQGDLVRGLPSTFTPELLTNSISRSSRTYSHTCRAAQIAMPREVIH